MESSERFSLFIYKDFRAKAFFQGLAEDDRKVPFPDSVFEYEKYFSPAFSGTAGRFWRHWQNYSKDIL